MNDIYADKILILDFGSQYTQLIARRVRGLGVYCEIHPSNITDEQIIKFNPKGIILSGGPESVTANQAAQIPTKLFELERPLLGICYGMHAMAKQLGGQVNAATNKCEFGHAQLQLTKACELWGPRPIPSTLDVWMSHGDAIKKLPPDFTAIATTNNTPIAAMAHKTKPWYGLQFHPEVTHTPQGIELLQQFVNQICHCKLNWQMAELIPNFIADIQQQVNQDEVILGLSGGVDSAVTAALLQRAIGNNLTCIFVDSGLLRQNEATAVMQTMAEQLGIRVIKVAAADQFMQSLAGVIDPEEKRKRIGKTFIDIFEAEAAKRTNARWLAQGTIYPDVIESAAASNSAHVIKSHHNVGGLPEHMKLALVEPLRKLFKDEVRTLGTALGLPDAIIKRHPFPGPGLAVRILGEVKSNYITIVRAADHIFLQELKAADWYHKVSQAFAVFLPVKSVGVMGDGRRYDYVISLRAVTTTDFMTAQWVPLPPELLAQVANRIINEVPGISRVTYDISSKPPATIEWE